MTDPILMPLIVTGIAVISVFLLSQGILSMVSGDSKVKELKERIEAQNPGHIRETNESGVAVKAAAAKWFESLGRKLGPKDDETLTSGQLAMIQAGVRNPGADGIFQGVKVFGTLAMVGLGVAIRTLAFEELSLHWSMFLILFLAAIGLYAPEIWLRSRIKSRQLKISDELPDALDLLVVCVESGMGLDQAIHRVSTELALSAPILSEELRTLTLQLRAGKPRQEALRSLAQRVGLDDLNSLCTLLIQADVFGISVAQTLRVYSDALRTKRFQRAEEKAAKMPVKLLFPLILFILPALFVAIMGPAGIRMMSVMGSMK